ncbi:MAG TPA: retron St85 family RNA-directed DNA polymerase [Blastocatellia bacterium]|nr:retron St85 family RNA-directed DNA polymerase [Blastocatellia bacterium]
MILEQTAARLDLPVSFLLKLAKTASHRYKEYTIPKRTGGTRTIHHPARELKLVQNWLLQYVLIRLPVHAVATAYSKGSSIKRNAEMHVANNYLLRVDFQDFFPSLTGSDVVAVLRANQRRLANINITEQDIYFIRRIVCRRDSLTIGAPTSPQLSNAIMFEFDETWSRRAHDLEVTYTRYADDLYFSTNRPNVLRDILDGLREYLKAGGVPTLRINEKKTAFSSRKRRRLAAGLVLTSDRRISIGRHKKRMLKSLVLKLKRKELEPVHAASLRGWICYLRSVEPAFVLALQRKYDLDFDASLTWEI